MKKWLVCCSSVLTALFVSSCTGGDAVGECDSNTDCMGNGSNYVCDANTNTCVCVPDCYDKCCGDDGCGGQCADNCKADKPCNSETCQCELLQGCRSDADCEGANQVCEVITRTCVCVPDCSGKCCGDDGCGGECQDSCGADSSCSPDSCQCELDQACQSDTDCEGINQVCDTDSGQCVCVPDCSSKCCGDDGCGGQCEQPCETGSFCNAETCECELDQGCRSDADCAGANEVCDLNTGLCVCVPDCSGKCCGDDGCGGQCAQPCETGSVCNTTSCLCETICDLDADGDPCSSDCDDNNNAIFHGQSEDCTNQIDDNCNGIIDCQESSCQMDAACVQCDTLDGVGDSCDLEENTCSCNNVCGEHMIAPEAASQFIEHYCFEECSDSIACENENDTCTTFPSDGGQACLPAGLISSTWSAIIIAQGADPRARDVTQLGDVDASLDGQDLVLTTIYGEGSTASNGQEFVILMLRGFVESAQPLVGWFLEVDVPKENWAIGTLRKGMFEDEIYSDFDAYLWYVVYRQEDQGYVPDRVFVKALAAVGILNLTKVTQPGSTGSLLFPNFSRGELDLGILGYEAEMTVP